MNQPATLTRYMGSNPHPNADSLEFAVLEGIDYQVIVRKDDYKSGDLVVYIEPDSIVPDRPQYEFLNDKRIRAVRLRGEYSMGLLVRASVDEMLEILDAKTPIGGDVSEIMGVKHYQPKSSGGKITKPVFRAPFEDFGKFGVANIRRDGRIIEEGTQVIAREKLHGQNARLTFHEGQLYIGTRNVWATEPGHPTWALSEHPALDEIRQFYSDMIFYFERVNCQGAAWTYRDAQGLDQFYLLAARYKDDGKFVSPAGIDALADYLGFKQPTLLLHGAYDMQQCIRLAQGESYHGAKFRESIVVQKVKHDGDPCFLKSISPEYLACK